MPDYIIAAEDAGGGAKRLTIEHRGEPETIVVSAADAAKGKGAIIAAARRELNAARAGKPEQPGKPK